MITHQAAGVGLSLHSSRMSNKIPTKDYNYLGNMLQDNYLDFSSNGYTRGEGDEIQMTMVKLLVI